MFCIEVAGGLLLEVVKSVCRCDEFGTNQRATISTEGILFLARVPKYRANGNLARSTFRVHTPKSNIQTITYTFTFILILSVGRVR
jgi:hypothetical protein